MNQLTKLSETEMRNVDGGFFPLVAIAVAVYKTAVIASDPKEACEYIKERAAPGSGKIECED